MKILVVGDIHWSAYSSILRSRGKRFSTRLEYLIKSMNWVEDMSKKYACEEEIFLGDTFDKPDLSAEEISALSEICWNKNCRARHFIVGNHESGVASLIYNSTQALHKVGNIVDTASYHSVDDKTEFLFLPYVTEDNRIPLEEHAFERNKNKKLVVFSHNDIKDFQMGMFLSKTGYAIKDIEDNCDLYINGHLHNGGWVTKKILNLGILCGQNFSEDAFKYEHHIGILDTDTLNIEFITNPYALNFYKVDVNNKTDIMMLFTKLDKNAVISFRCLNTREEELNNYITDSKNIVAYKVLTYEEDIVRTELNADTSALNNFDHLNQFEKFIIDHLGNSDIVREELQEICK